jgi:hypothetical protein
MKQEKVILFEPWGLGDALIAFAIALQGPTRISVACNSKWHEVINASAQGMALPKLIGVNLQYRTRNHDQSHRKDALPRITERGKVLSIRGDVRDYFAARKIFPESTIQMNGWVPFLAHHSALVDIPFANGWLPVLNRYKAWASIASVKWATIEEFYQQKRPMSGVRSIVVHVGAQWRSKQFPHAAELVNLLRDNYDVRVVAGLIDSLPEGIHEHDVCRLVNSDLVDAFKSSTYVIANDSGPMHLAALLHCRTIVVTNQAAMKAWLPPNVYSVESMGSPRGYKRRNVHPSDVISNGWPSPRDILNNMEVL